MGSGRTANDWALPTPRDRRTQLVVLAARLGGPLSMHAAQARGGKATRLVSALAGSESSRGIRDIAISMLPQVFGAVTGFLGSVVLARGLDPLELGRYALASSLALVATTFSDLGIGQTAIRFASRAVADRDIPRQHLVLRWALKVRLLQSLAVTVVFLLISPLIVGALWHDPGGVPLARLALFGGALGVFVTVPQIYFQSMGRFGVNAAVTSLQRGISFLGILLLAFFQIWSVKAVLVASLGATLVAASVFLALVPRTALWPLVGEQARLSSVAPGGGQGSRGHGENAREFASYMMLASLIVMLTMQADVWLMGYYLEKEQIGIYNVAGRFALPVGIVTTAMSTALWPRVAACKAGSNLRGFLARWLKVSGVLALACTLYAVLGPLLAPWVFGASYASSTSLGQLLALRHCIAVAVVPIVLAGFSVGLQRVYWIINVAQLLGVVLINVLLLPVLGPVASAVALIINELGNGIGCWLLLWPRLRAMTEREPGGAAGCEPLAAGQTRAGGAE